MTDLGPINMKQHLATQAKGQQRLERMLGGILRPKSGVPSFPTGIALGTVDNDLSRYGSRLIVWSFDFTFSGYAAGFLLATAPVGFRPTAGIRAVVTANSTGTANVLLDLAGNLTIVGSSVTPTEVSGTIHFTAAP